MQSLQSRVVWLTAARLVSFALAIVLPLFVARRLSQANFALYKQSFLVLTTSLAILPLGFHMSAFYFLPREPEHRARFVWNILLFHAATGGLGALAILLFPQGLARWFQSEAIGQMAPLIAAMVLLWTVSSFLETVVTANQEVRLSATLIVLSQTSKTLFILGAAIVWGSVRSLIVAAIVQGLFQVSLLFGYLGRRFPGFWREFDLPTLQRQLRYSLPYGMAGLLWGFQVDMHNYVVSHRFSAEAFAIYSVGCFQLPLIGMLTESVSSVLLPRLGILSKEGRQEQILSLVSRASHQLALFCFPAYAFLTVVAADFITVLFTERYRDSAAIFQVNVLIIPFYILIADPILRTYAHARFFQVSTHLPVTLLQISTIGWLIDRFGLMGAIGSAIGTMALSRTLQAGRAVGLLGIRMRHLPLFASLPRIALCALAAALSTYALREALAGARPLLRLAACGVVFGLVYVVALIVLRVLREDEWNQLREWKQRLMAGRMR